MRAATDMHDQRPARSWWQIFADFGPQAQAAFLGASFVLHGLVGISLTAMSFATGFGPGPFGSLIYIFFAYIIGLPVALLLGWPVATTLEWFGLRSWLWYVTGGAALGGALFWPFAINPMTYPFIGEPGDIAAVGAVYGMAYAALFRYGLFDRPEP